MTQAVEKHASQRETIQKWLATIPETLDGCHRLAELHHTSPRLHECLNKVLVAVFFVMERIADKLSKTSKSKETLFFVLLRPVQLGKANIANLPNKLALTSPERSYLQKRRK